MLSSNKTQNSFIVRPFVVHPGLFSFLFKPFLCLLALSTDVCMYDRDAVTENRLQIEYVSVGGAVHHGVATMKGRYAVFGAASPNDNEMLSTFAWNSLLAMVPCLRPWYETTAPCARLFGFLVRLISREQRASKQGCKARLGPILDDTDPTRYTLEK